MYLISKAGVSCCCSVLVEFHGRQSILLMQARAETRARASALCTHTSRTAPRERGIMLWCFMYFLSGRLFSVMHWCVRCASKSTAKRLSAFSPLKKAEIILGLKSILKEWPMAKRVFIRPILRAQHVDFCNLVFLLPWMKSPMTEALVQSMARKTSLTNNPTGLLIKNAKDPRPGN